MARSALLLQVAVAAAFGVALKNIVWQQGEAFVPVPNLRGAETAGALAAAVLAASVVAPNPALADQAKFGFFGLGGGQSDAYNIRFDTVSPYSEFSDPKDAVYKAKGEEEQNRRKVQLQESWRRLATVEDFIKKKQSEGAKQAITSQAYLLRGNMEYFSGDFDSASYKKARECFQSLSDTEVEFRTKNWKDAAKYFADTMRLIEEWKVIADYKPI
eukprot:TRINITY_DN1022_c0_g1_i1.p1 TRINITY_DN1022_c0_g1~~TRINITY_DN1022_c0_g1_i1.p1  ORF type:complete len:239 (-),score=52.62 TRINITY_DN1022_c0_g1_i1:215-859(-)